MFGKKEDKQSSDEKKGFHINLKKEIYMPKITIPIFLLACICIAIYCTGIAPKSLQNDTFYTVAVGKYISQNGIKNLDRDPFSWHNLPYVFPHWLYDFMMYIIYDTSGFFGIYVSTMVFASILGIVIFTLSYKKSKDGVISTALTIFAIYTMRDFIAARSQLVTFILFGLEILWIEDFLETRKKRYAIGLVLIALAIANLHCAVFPFYFILYMPYVAEFLLEVLADLDIDIFVYKAILSVRYHLEKNEEKKELIAQKKNKLVKVRQNEIIKRKERRENPYKIVTAKNYVVVLLIIIMVIAGLTGLLNPTGDTAYTYLYKTMKGNTTNSINEHLPLTLMDAKPFAIMIIMLMSVLAFTKTKIKLHDLFLFIGLIYMSFKSRRQVALFAVICAPILAELITSYIKSIDTKLLKKITEIACTISGAIIIICCFTLYTTDELKDKKNENYVNTRDYPVAASIWINENLDVNKIRLYNEYNYGSYLLMQGIPVFIDSRADLYSPEFNTEPEIRPDGNDIFTDVIRIDDLQYDYKDAFKVYGVTHIILHSKVKLALMLEKDPNYELIYYRGNFKIFEKKDAVNNGVYWITDKETVIKESVSK